MKSFGIKRDENDPRWAKFIEWLNNESCIGFSGDASTDFYGLKSDGYYGIEPESSFDRIITLDEWEAEFMTKLAGREYDFNLLDDFKNYFCKLESVHQFTGVGCSRKYFSFEESMIKDMVDGRYAKTDRISELKQQIEKLSNELKELEG